ncbi:hypothetical protein [Marinobacter salarius]|uniref:hypothetical protein n=1 Tax=Marinobacter salarius TaxID=1420917 RepID=UPI0012F7329B|nr:hypothetical protein [Marinobacter salarius]
MIDHEQAWRGYDVLGHDFLSKVQRECISAAMEENLCRECQLESAEDIEEKVVLLFCNKSDAYFKIYNGDAELQGVDEFFHVEQCGCKTPSEFIGQVIEKMRAYSC